MREKKGFQIRNDTVEFAEAAAAAGVMLLLACLFDYRYATNDDMFINAILSGKYTGVPDLRNIRVGIPLNALFCLFYRVCPWIPWFGIGLISFQYASLWSILTGLCRKLGGKSPSRVISCIAVHLLLVGIMINELVTVQYTYTAALLMASAALRLYDMEDPFSRRGSLQFAGILLQYLAAFCLRTEIFLFLLPFLFLLILVHYYRNSGLRVNKGELKRWGLVCGALVCGVAAVSLVNRACYRDSRWQEYLRSDKYRVQMYDYLAFPAYDENRDFYEGAGISEVQYQILRNYNFALEEEIDSEMLKSIADYVNEGRTSGYQGLKRVYYQMFTLPLGEGIWSYTHRVLLDTETASEDYPWNIVCGALYFVLLFLTCFSKRVQNLVFLILLFSIRTGLWMYLILRQRMPVRVTHALFLMELACLLLLVLEELAYLEKAGGRKRPGWLYPGLAALLFTGAGIVAGSGLGSFIPEYRDTVAYNEEWEALLDYYGERKENFYFMDVYSIVNYTDRILDGEDSRPGNYDICGGWLAKSPLCREKYDKFGFSLPREALVGQDNVFFVAEQGCDLSWLTALYAEKGIPLQMEYRDTVAGRFDIIKLSVREGQDAGGE